MVYAAFNIVSSAKWSPINWNPIGIPSLSNLQGTDIPGNPATLTETVQISARYICNGLSDLVPISNAVVGEVGVNITSYFSKVSLNLLITNVLTFCAFL